MLSFTFPDKDTQQLFLAFYEALKYEFKFIKGEFGHVVILLETNNFSICQRYCEWGLQRTSGQSRQCC